MKKSKIITSCLMIMIILSVMPFFNFVKADAPNNSGSETKTFWESAGNPSKRDDPVLPPQPLCGGEALCLLDHRQLPGGL